MALELKRGDKDKKGSGGAPKVDVALKIMEFFDKNPMMKIIVPVVLLIVLCGVIVFVVLGDGILVDENNLGTTTAAEATDFANVMNGSNNPIKDKEVVELIEKDPLSADILATAVYKGCISGSSGLKTAMVQIGTEGDSLVLAQGEKIGDSEWEVIEINPQYIIVEAGDVQRKLELKNG